MKEKILLRETTAENQPPEYWRWFAIIRGRLIRNILILAPLKYAQEMRMRYLEGSYHETAWWRKDWLWRFFWFFAAVMVCRSFYVATAGFPDEWRWTLAVIGALVLTWLIDWAIGSWITELLCQRNARADQEEINRKKHQATNPENPLKLKRTEAEQSVFDWAKSSYQHQHPFLLVVLAVLAIGGLGIEYAASLEYVRLRGEDADLLTYLVAMLGIILTILESCYKGFIIDYPKARRKISSKYNQYALPLEKEMPAEFQREIDEFWVLEGLTIFILDNPGNSAEQRQQVEAEIRKQLRCRQLRERYHEIEQACLSEIENLQREEQQRLLRMNDPTDLEREMKAKVEQIYKHYMLELKPLEQEAQELGCSIIPPDWKISQESKLQIESRSTTTNKLLPE